MNFEPPRVPPRTAREMRERLEEMELTPDVIAWLGRVIVMERERCNNPVTESPELA